MTADDAQVPPSVRAQLLATEHWSLLASRSTTQGEVLTRISMFLTLVSAGLVSLALIGQATRFSGAFVPYSIGVLAFVCLVGVLTQLRVMNVALDDAMYVIAMNRLRAAYVDLDPGVEPYLMASSHDDRVGMMRTYFFLGKRSDFNEVAASSMAFMYVMTAALLGLLAAAITAAAGAGNGLVVAVGLVVGVVASGASAWLGNRRFFSAWRGFQPLSPTPADGRPAGVAD